MIASKNLKRQIIIELIALLFLILATIYSVIAIKKSEANKISSVDGFVSVIDDTQMDKMVAKSDGEGLNGNGTIYTITNNNDKAKKYKIIIIPSVHNVKILENVKISVDDIYIYNLKELERNNGGYIIIDSILNAGYTKTYLIKAWYDKTTSEEIEKKDIKFEYRIVSSD